MKDSVISSSSHRSFKSEETILAFFFAARNRGNLQEESRLNCGLNRVARRHFPRRIFRARCREKLLNEAAATRHRLKGR